jgi:hypothetical protein
MTRQTAYRAPVVQLLYPEKNERLGASGAKVHIGADTLMGGVTVGISRQRPPNLRLILPSSNRIRDLKFHPVLDKPI